MIYEDSISRALRCLSVLCDSRNRRHRQCPANLYKDAFGRRRHHQTHHDPHRSLPLPHRSDHCPSRFLRVSDLEAQKKDIGDTR